jgi:hypothetical protein
MRPAARRFTWVLAGLMAVGIGASLAGTYRRVQVEARNRRVEIALEWTEVAQLTTASGQPVAPVLARLRAAGVTTLAIQEETLAALEQTGAALPQRLHLSDGRYGTRVTLDSPATLQRIQKALQLRGSAILPPHNDLPVPPGGTAFAVATAVQPTLQVAIPYAQLRTLGLGLPPEALEAAREARLRITGRIGNFPGVHPATAEAVLHDLSHQGASLVIFSGDEVLGYRGQEKAVAERLKPETSENPPSAPRLRSPIPLRYGAVEFGKQKGDEKLTAALRGEYVRVHSIQAAEMAQLNEVDTIERFQKAVKERNIRLCYVRLFTFAGADPVGENAAFIAKIARGLTAGEWLTGGGLELGEARPFLETNVPRWLFGLMALGVAAGAVWMLRLFCPLPEPASWLTLAGLSLLCVGLAASGETGRKLVALLAGIVFPTAACLWNFPSEPPLARSRTAFSAALGGVGALWKASSITALGILLVVGLLATRPFMVKASQFLGIKAQHGVPVLIVALAALAGGAALQGETWANYKARAVRAARSVLAEPARYGTLLLGLVALVALMVALARTGNDSGVGVSGFEMKMRAVLDRILPVRPRTKEFLIGHPAFVLGLAWCLRGRRNLGIPLYVVGSLGQVSLLNTFCHIHTPLIISAWRDVTGLILGALIGLAGFLLLENLWFRAQKPSNGL